MGYWENTTYMHSDDPARVLTALESIFASEGMKRVPKPPPRGRLNYEPMQYAGALQNDLWGVAVFPGADAWTVVKTAPLELLAEKAQDDSHMRLSSLCRELSAAAFQVNIYDGTATLLCEVSEQGEAFLSGYGHFEDPFLWHGQALSEEFIRARFRYLPFQSVVGDDTYGDEFAFALAREFGGAHSEHCDNGICVNGLVTHRLPDIPGGLFAYFEWPGPSRVKIPACSWEDWRRRRN